MLSRSQYLITSTLGGIALVLTVANAVIGGGVRDQQRDVTQRALFIQQAAQLEPLLQGIARGVAELATRANDADLKRLLESQGITVTAAPKAKEAQP
ncbi:MAG: hypothetical protein MUD06_11305 [Rhodospirillales bacterium]|nr:hypothetical protein [Gammaproteobacteria bacterium]MCU0894887.1 hypothetical protein [Rhodospirillales bacterium]